MKRFLSDALLVSMLTIILPSFLFGQEGDPAPKPGGEGQTRKIERFGIDGSNAKWAKVIAELGDNWTGVNAVAWGHLEPRAPEAGKHSYRWRRADRLVKAFQAVGRKLQVNIRVFSDWALEHSSRKKAHHPGTGRQIGAIVRIKKEHLADWSAFIGALAERYDGDGKDDMPGLKYPVTHIQIESEAENVWDGADGYVEALKAAYEAAKKASENAKVMSAGFNIGDFAALSPEERKKAAQHPLYKRKMGFFEGFFAKAGKHFDVLSLHLNHGHKEIPETVEWFRKQMKDRGYEKPIWSEDTRSGPPLGGKFSTKEEKDKIRKLEQGDKATVEWYRREQAALLVKKAATAFASGVEKVFISTDVDWVKYHMPGWRHSGLLDSHGKPKPAYHSFKTMVARLDGFTKAESLDMGESVFACRFKRPSGDVYVLWCRNDKGVPVSLPVKSKSLRVTDISGKTAETLTSKLQIDVSPVFVEEKPQ
jgi:hypothetical protein